MTNYLILTGGSNGIGEKTLARFQKQGWKCINLSRSPCKIEGVKHISIDLASRDWEAAHAQALTSLVKDALKICLVHNAAVCNADTIASLSGDEMRAVLEINLVAPVILNHHLIPFMKAGSSIIYVGSTLSEQAVPGRASYVTSKHGLVGLMRATCQDLAGKEISTCCICPGFVDTKMLRKNVDGENLKALLRQKVTANRLIEPEEIAEIIEFCAHHPVMNGAVLHGNLGQIMR